MATLTQSNTDNFLTWQKVNGGLALSRLQDRGIPDCFEGYNLSDVTSKQTLSIGAGGTMYSIYWSDDGFDFYYVGLTSQLVYQKTVSTPFDISTVVATQTKSVTEDTLYTEIRFNTDGTKCYLLGFANDIIYQYSLTAWDISTLSYDSVSLDCTSQSTTIAGFSMSSTNIYVSGDDTIYQYSVTNYDLSTAVFVGSLVVTVDSDIFSVVYRNESKLYFVGTSSSKVYELSIAEGNIARGTITGSTEALTNPSGMYIDLGGFTMWINETGDNINEYWIGC